jgi:hypothetical protein
LPEREEKPFSLREKGGDEGKQFVVNYEKIKVEVGFIHFL